MQLGLLQTSMKILQRVMIAISLSEGYAGVLFPPNRGSGFINSIIIKPTNQNPTLSYNPFQRDGYFPDKLRDMRPIYLTPAIQLKYNRQMYNPLSTRNKPASTEKSQASARFFKKFSTDENERNYLNHQDKQLLKSVHSTKNIISLTSNKTEDSKSKPFSKHKKSQVNFINLAKPVAKAQICISHADHFHHSSNKENVKSMRKENSVKNLKLTTSTSSEFPILAKSVSQTTVNRKMDDNKLRLLEKIGMKKKSQKVPEKGVNINQFKLGKKLGSGRFGNVYLAEEKHTRTIFALKVMSKTKIKEADMEDQVFWQIKLQMYMNHPNVLKLFGFFDDAKNIYLILEYCSQCLFKDFRAKVKLSEEETSYLTKQVISALKYMHNENIIHRDIKPQNIMMEFGVLKMSDFGWSTYSPLYKRQTFCGTVDYVPPEIVEGNEYDERVDIWALGVLMYELASGSAPFETKDENITYDKIVNSECKYPPHFSKSLKDTISKILDKNPERRPNLQQIESQPWFQKFKGVGRYISKQIWAAWDHL